MGFLCFIIIIVDVVVVVFVVVSSSSSSSVVKSEMKRVAYVKHLGGKKRYRVLMGKSNERHYLEDVGLYGRIILK